MKFRYVFILLTGFSPLFFAYSEADLKRLEFTNNCENCDLSGLDFTKVGFLEVISKAPIVSIGSKINIIDSDLTGANLKNIRLQDCNFQGSDLTGANLSKAIIAYSNFEGVDFTEADLSFIDLSFVNLEGANFSKANLTKGELWGNKTAGTIFIKANMTNASISDGGQRVDFIEVDFSFANLAGARLSGNFDKANFTNVNLKGAEFAGSSDYPPSINGTIFLGADMSSTKMKYVNLKEAIFCETLLPWGNDNSGCEKLFNQEIEKSNENFDDIPGF